MDFRLKKDQYSKAIIVLWGSLDSGSIAFGFYIANSFLLYKYGIPEHHKDWLAILILAWLSAFILTNAYALKLFKQIKTIIISLSKCFIISLTFLCFSIFIKGQLHQEDSIFLSFLYLIFLLLTTTLRIVQLLLYRKIRSLKKFQTRYIIVGDTLAGQNFYDYLKSKKYPGFVFMGFFDNESCSGWVAGSVQDIPAYCKAHHINQIFYALPHQSDLLEFFEKFTNNNYIHFGIIENEICYPKVKLNRNMYNENISVLSLN